LEEHGYKTTVVQPVDMFPFTSHVENVALIVRAWPMIKPIMKDVLFLAQKSEPATAKDKNIAIDLLDTLQANADRCVGMAANMIGERKRIIVFNLGKTNVVMFNPVIVKKDKPYETEEGCLSLVGERACTRYENIEVEYQDMKMRKQRSKFSGFTAQIIQHECDHLEGIII